MQQEETKRLSFIATSQTDNGTNEGFQFLEQDVTNNLDATALRQQQKEMSKTLSIDRTNDSVYTATTSVVKAIMTLSKGVEKAAAIEYLGLVRSVGIELKTLLSSVDELTSIFPPQALKYVLQLNNIYKNIDVSLISFNLIFGLILFIQRSRNGTQSFSKRYVRSSFNNAFGPTIQ